ncbi:MAG TPA: nucleotide exchange factor GrpE [Phototrophicaceae bacterium]|nr:nucleotide exchange factor GrpE [Phototrophicaceae bacterium]
MGQEQTDTPVTEQETMNENTQAHDHATADAAEAVGTQAADAVGTSATPPISEVQSKLEEYLAGWQRTRAEFANYKKRTEREMSESRQKGVLEALEKVLPIIDDFERAMGNVPAEFKDHPWMNGVSLMLKKFEKLLGEHEVTVLDPVGQPFDPSRHEAIGMDDSDTTESGHVTVTLQKGYVSGDKVLRPALVRVAN